MKVKFIGDVKALEKGIYILCTEKGFQVSDEGIPVHVERVNGFLEVHYENGSGLIRYQEKHHFFRAMGLFLEHITTSDRFHIVEEPQFSTNGVMIDASRNAVMTTGNIKRLIRNMALMGLNMIMMYTEDTYTIETKPYFGYMRGRYSHSELKDCDDYAFLFGIEIIPCIQTLGHLEQALKWDYADKIKDTDDILLAGDENTYAMIEDMIRSACAPFRSKRIHVGMDEAHNLGLGRYLKLNGYRKGFDIMNAHLARIREIAAKYNLQPMIWSDMYFRLGSKTGDYYDMEAVIPEDVIQQVPKDVSLVYWDYYHHDENVYSEFLKRHQEFGTDLVFAGGIWTWAGITVNYEKTFHTTNAALAACKKHQVKQVIATMWGDDGAETNIFSGMLGLQLFAEHGYAKELDMKKTNERFSFCTDGNPDHFMELEKPDKFPEYLDKFSNNAFNPSKYLLWQDVLTGLFDKSIDDLDLFGYYSNLQKRYESYARESGVWRFVFDMPAKLCSVLAVKYDIGVKIKDCYDRGDTSGLKHYVNTVLPELYKKVELLKAAHREQWMHTYKPFGWEVLDIRYGGVLARIDTAIVRITDYLNGKIEKIEELEEDRLYFQEPKQGQSNRLYRCNSYRRIASASPF